MISQIQGGAQLTDQNYRGSYDYNTVDALFPVVGKFFDFACMIRIFKRRTLTLWSSI